MFYRPNKIHLLEIEKEKREIQLVYSSLMIIDDRILIVLNHNSYQ